MGQVFTFAVFASRDVRSALMVLEQQRTPPLVFCYLLFDLGHRLCGVRKRAASRRSAHHWRGVAQSQFGFPLASAWTRWSFVALRVFNNGEVKVDPPG